MAGPITNQTIAPESVGAGFASPKIRKAPLTQIVRLIFSLTMIYTNTVRSRTLREQKSPLDF
ncbi:MAG: hypothetical protein CVV41_16585 [Candidatus Riflebacteria bacterium HGW-Riflebacteria-1]|nr:MAG: hypothetical protein CVV41_16585 [Candidatus Riflebacteria bacterium HGW-Riflebacteria-1]